MMDSSARSNPRNRWRLKASPSLEPLTGGSVEGVPQKGQNVMIDPTVTNKTEKTFRVTVTHEIETYYTVKAEDGARATKRLEYVITHGGVSSDGLNDNIRESVSLSTLTEAWGLQDASRYAGLSSQIVDESVTGWELEDYSEAGA